MNNGLDFLYSPNSQFYEAQQRMRSDDLANTYKSLSNQTLEAQMPGHVGNSMSLMAKGQVDQAGMQDKINKNHMDYLSSVDDNQLKQLGDFGEKLSMISGQLESVPPMFQEQAFEQMASRYGLDVNHPAIQALRQQTDPSTFSKALGAMGQGIVTNTGKAINDRQTTQMQNESHERVAQIGADGRYDKAVLDGNTKLQVEQQRSETALKKKQMEVDAALALANKKSAAALQMMKPDQRITYLNSIPDDEKTDTERLELQRLIQHDYNKRVLGNPAIAPEMLGGKTPTTPMQRAGQAASDLVNPNKAQAPQPIDPAEIQKQGYAYEPDKYEYAIIDGKVKRRPKQR